MNDESNKLDSHHRGGVRTAFARIFNRFCLVHLRCIAFGMSNGNCTYMIIIYSHFIHGAGEIIGALFQFRQMLQHIYCIGMWTADNVNKCNGQMFCMKLNRGSAVGENIPVINQIIISRKPEFFPAHVNLLSKHKYLCIVFTAMS